MAPKQQPTTSQGASLERWKRAQRQLKLYLFVGALVIIGALLIIWFISRFTSPERVKSRASELVTLFKQGQTDHKRWLELVSPAVRNSLKVAVEDLGLKLDEVLARTAFPLDLVEVAAAPDPKGIEVNVKGKLARVYFVDDMGNAFQFYLVYDDRNWFFYLETPVEERRYGSVDELFAGP